MNTNSSMIELILKKNLEIALFTLVMVKMLNKLNPKLVKTEAVFNDWPIKLIPKMKKFCPELVKYICEQ